MILNLTLKREFFDQILIGEKTIEYREIKPFWARLEKKKYSLVKFRNGYNANSPVLICECKGIRKKDMYEIYLGKIIKTENLKYEQKKLLT